MLQSKKLPQKLLPPCFSHRLILDALRHLSTTAEIASRNPSTAPARAPAVEPHFLVRYLVDSCGFSKSKAAEVSKPVLARITSTETPAAVISFLTEQGFTKAHIRQVVSGEPSVLCASVGTLEPKIRAMKDAGLSGPDIRVLFSTRPRAFGISDLGAKIQFWAILFESKERLLRAILKNRNIMFSSLEEEMKPNVSLLCECVESNHRVGKMISQRNQLLTANTDYLRKVIEQVDSLGIPRSSRLFNKALYVLVENSAKNLEAKFELLKSFGWSESELVMAMQKNPTFLGSSKKKIQSIMEFLLKEVRCEPSYVAARPTILTFSLEGRIVPRHCVLHMLELNGLIDEGYNFFNAVLMTEKDFRKRYVLRYGGMASVLYQSYVSACTRGYPS